MADPHDALMNRMQENYKIREGERKFMMYFDPALPLPLWTAGKGEHGVDIIPYIAGANDPAVHAGKIKEGEPQYLLDIYVHQNIGPGDEQFVCLKANYRLPCPVCEYRNTVVKDAPPDDATQRDKDLHDKVLDALRYKRRVAYNIINRTTEQEEDKGIQVFEIAHWFMERELQILAGGGKARGKGYVFFAHPKLGKTVWFNRTGVGATSTSYSGYAFEDRDYDIPQEWLDGVYSIDQHIIIPTYEQVHATLWDGIEKEKETGDGGDTGVRARRRGAPTEEEPAEETTAEEPRRRAAPVAEPEQAPTSPRRPRTAAAETDGAVDEPRRPRRTRDEPTEEPANEPANEPAEEAAAPKRLGKAGGTEPAEEAPANEPAEEAPANEPAEEAAADATKDRCPVADGRYGVDTDKFEECDTCSIWESCVKSAERRKRDGR